MGFYKFKKSKCIMHSPVPVVELEKNISTEILDNGVIYKGVNFSQKDLTSSEYVKDIPNRDEYSLENLLSAGVPLEVINTSHILDKTNIADMESTANIKISSIIDNNKEAFVEPLDNNSNEN